MSSKGPNGRRPARSWWPFRRGRRPEQEPGGRPPARPGQTSRPGALPGGGQAQVQPLWVSGGAEHQDVPGQLRPTRPRMTWVAVEPGPTGQLVRRAYRHLVDRWGSSRQPLRLVQVPGVVWVGLASAPQGPLEAVVGAGQALVLARARNDRRYQVYHVNLEQAASWSVGRLEQDVLAPWTNPLRHLLYRWLEAGVELTGVDAVVLCTGPAACLTAESAAVGCALAGWRPPWVETRPSAAPKGHIRTAAWHPHRLADRLPWPGGWHRHVEALQAAASGTSVQTPFPCLTVVTFAEGREPVVTHDLDGRLQLWARPQAPGQEPAPGLEREPAAQADSLTRRLLAGQAPPPLLAYALPPGGEQGEAGEPVPCGMIGTASDLPTAETDGWRPVTPRDAGWSACCLLRRG